MIETGNSWSFFSQLGRCCISPWPFHPHLSVCPQNRWVQHQHSSFGSSQHGKGGAGGGRSPSGCSRVTAKRGLSRALSQVCILSSEMLIFIYFFLRDKFPLKTSHEWERRQDEEETKLTQKLFAEHPPFLPPTAPRKIIKKQKKTPFGKEEASFWYKHFPAEAAKPVLWFGGVDVPKNAAWG